MKIDNATTEMPTNEELIALKAKAQSLMERTVKYMVQKQTDEFFKRRNHLITDSLNFMNHYLKINGVEMSEQEIEKAYLVHKGFKETLDA